MTEVKLLILKPLRRSVTSTAAAAGAAAGTVTAIAAAGVYTYLHKLLVHHHHCILVLQMLQVLCRVFLALLQPNTLCFGKRQQ
jgi:hypothetical protein